MGTVKSKEDVLNKQASLISLARERGLIASDWDIIRNAATSAMDEWAKIKTIAFAVYLEDCTINVIQDNYELFEKEFEQQNKK